MNQLPDWMYHAIEESFTCQFASTTARAIPVALPVFLHYFDPDAGTLIISSPVRMKRVENVRQRPKVAILFSPIGAGPDEPKHVLLETVFCRLGTTTTFRSPIASRMEQAIPGYTPGLDGYPLVLPLPFTFDRDNRCFSMPILHQTPAP